MMLPSMRTGFFWIDGVKYEAVYIYWPLLGTSIMHSMKPAKE